MSNAFGSVSFILEKRFVQGFLAFLTVSFRFLGLSDGKEFVGEVIIVTIISHR
jgi:hypothetical protein